MIAISIMVNGIPFSDVVQNVSKLTCTIFGGVPWGYK